MPLERLLRAFGLISPEPPSVAATPESPTGAVWPSTMNHRDFWANYFMLEERHWPRERESETLEVAVTLPVSEAHSLVFDVYNADVDVYLQPKDRPRLKLGWSDSAHWHPDVFRWEETSSICRHLSRLGAEYQHPGVPLLLLSLFTPVTDDADYGACHADICEALTVLGLFSPKEIALLARRALREFDEGAHWERSSSGFVLIGEPPVYTLRSEGKDFPWRELEKMLEAIHASA